jgi:hypothetical protein
MRNLEMWNHVSNHPWRETTKVNPNLIEIYGTLWFSGRDWSEIGGLTFKYHTNPILKLGKTRAGLGTTGSHSCQCTQTLTLFPISMYHTLPLKWQPSMHPESIISQLSFLKSKASILSMVPILCQATLFSPAWRSTTGQAKILHRFC